MDKALSKIQELEQELQKIEGENSENDEKIVSLVEEYCDLEYEIEDLQNENKLLKDKKKNIEEVPKKRKINKQNLIKVLLLFYTLIVLIGCGLGSFLVYLGVTSLIMASSYSVIIPLLFNAINKKYPIENLDSIENSILKNNSELNILKNKKKELDEKMDCLQDIRTNYKDEIKDLKQQILSIMSLRNKVIEEFCKDNLELDKKIDSVYENEEIEKVKVKEKVVK